MEWGCSSHLLSHEEEREIGRKEEDGCGQLLTGGRGQPSQPVPLAEVANLIVVLNTDDKLLPGQLLGRGAIGALAERRKALIIDEAMRQGFRKVAYSSIVHEICGRNGFQQCSESMVEIIVILCIEL